MASAVLTSCNETNWCQSDAKFMSKGLIPNLNSTSLPTKRTSTPILQLNGHCVDDSPVVAHSAPEDASSLSEKPSKFTSLLNGFNHGDYVNFNLSSFSRKDAMQLKSRLMDDLDRVRELSSRIERPDFVKKTSGIKRANGLGFGKESKRMQKEITNPNLMKMCGQVLSKVMKQKTSWIFNTPVDAEGLKLHDYFDIIKNPMDLGTVKSKLSKNMYPTPEEFEADVRLTFDNAMLYNPKGHAVNIMAQQLLRQFTEQFRPVYMKFLKEQRERGDDYEEEAQGSSYHLERSSDFAPQIEPASSASNHPRVCSPVAVGSPARVPMMKTSCGKLPKPKAKDPNKRVMSLEEKHRLGAGLQSLPPEKTQQVVQIVRKRNGHLTDDGDEIELDMEAMDVETLWELDRLVTNWRKMVSKTRRQALLGNNGASSGNDYNQGVQRPERETEGKKFGEEEVDIGDEMPSSNFPPVEIDVDGGGSSSSTTSSSSSSGSSSSSDSDSGSSSESDSGEAEANSRL